MTAPRDPTRRPRDRTAAEGAPAARRAARADPCEPVPDAEGAPASTHRPRSRGALHHDDAAVEGAFPHPTASAAQPGERSPPESTIALPEAEAAAARGPERVDALTARLVAGDPDALAALYEAHFDRMVATIRRIARRDESFALDCAQDAWIRIARHPVRCPTAAALTAWLRRVAISAVLDRLRSDASRRLRELAWAAPAPSDRGERWSRRAPPRDPIDDRANDPRRDRAEGWPKRSTRSRARTLASADAIPTSDAAEAIEMIESIERSQRALRMALESSAADVGSLLILRFRAGLTIAQIGGLLGLGPAAVDSRLRRAIRRLRDALPPVERTTPRPRSTDPGNSR